MNEGRRAWVAYIFGVFMTFIFAYYLLDISHTHQAISKGVEIIRFDTGFGALALTGLAPLVAIAELCFKKGWVTPSTLHKWGGTALISSFLALAASGYFISTTLSEKLQHSGYTECKDPQEISRISRGQSLIFVKGSCDLVTPSQEELRKPG